MKTGILLSLLFSAALAVRLVYAVPGFENPERLMRPDSASYLAPAESMAHGAGYCGTDGKPTALRVPLYPLALAAGMKVSNGFGILIALNVILASLAVPLVFLAAREFGLGKGLSALAASLYAISPTALAVSPMFLSDGMFASFTALEAFLLTGFVRRRKSFWLFLAVLAGGAAVLVRPLNLLWIAPLIFVSFFVKTSENTAVRFVLCPLTAVLLFALVFAPWIIRNHNIGAGWRIDAVSADSLKHNASIVESRITKLPAAEFRQMYEKHFAETFALHPERWQTEDSKLDYEEKYLTGILKQHPFTYLTSFFRPVNFVPDIPSFLENLGLASGERGTADVIVSHGLLEGIRHYFGGNYWPLLLAGPFALVLLATYLGAAWTLLFRQPRELMTWLLFLTLCIYYYTVTGAVAYPRFSLPGLPFLCVLAAAALEKAHSAQPTPT